MSSSVSHGIRVHFMLIVFVYQHRTVQQSMISLSDNPLRFPHLCLSMNQNLHQLTRYFEADSLRTYLTHVLAAKIDKQLRLHFF